MKKYIEKLHFITHDLPNYTHLEQVQVACEAGAKWVQYRCLSKSDEELVKEINLISAVCDDWGTTLIVTDHIHLKDSADIQGFHIEDTKADIKKIRSQLGESYTLGGSANTVESLIRLAKEGVDYAGLGPFKMTTTKPNGLPLLDIQSYANAVKRLNLLNIDLPILAVGGVTLAAVEDLMTTGIHGIAASAAINQSKNLYEAYQDFYRLVK